ncbi:ECF transporter S component [Ectobacillus ponti]|uniref:ECF transporter S component n=1 Tax=Ectobacillus ponti TaxID=2961894 RepID=A0AA41X8G2_9BACI|nr:ECF transporter S component [Ectobacillus ponti]MCP8970712.1 ECF transporter S component [Ectobacillus ponti]
MSKYYRSILIALPVLLLGMLICSAVVTDRYFLWMSFLFLAVAMLPFYVRFERKAFSSREIVLIAVLAAIAAVSRVPFAVLPSIQPTSFVIIISGIVLGGESGFLIGATAALVSNLFLGQGPWTPWQMFSWGMMGLTSGLLGNTWLLRRTAGRVLFGFLWGFLYGWIMNGWVLLGFLEGLTWPSIVSTYAMSFYFDLAHACSNAVFLALFSANWMKIMTRFQQKYGLLQVQERRKIS